MYNIFSLVAPVAGVGIVAALVFNVVVTFVVIFVEDGCGKVTDNLMVLSF